MLSTTAGRGPQNINPSLGFYNQQRDPLRYTALAAHERGDTFNLFPAFPVVTPPMTPKGRLASAYPQFSVPLLQSLTSGPHSDCHPSPLSPVSTHHQVSAPLLSPTPTGGFWTFFHDPQEQ